MSPDLLRDMYHFVMPEHTLLGKRSLSGLPVYHLSQALESESNVSQCVASSALNIVAVYIDRCAL